MDIIGQYLLYAVVFGLPVWFVVRWVYGQWHQANMPAFWAWMLQNRRRDQAIRATREKMDALEQRVAGLESLLKQYREYSERAGTEGDNWTAQLDGALNRLGDCERTLARLQHRLRQRGIDLNG